MLLRVSIVILISFFPNWLLSQIIKDPCLTSISPIGRFKNSEDIVNLCRCDNNFLSADLLEWNGEEWEGRLRSYIVLPPPPGCNVSSIWLGYRNWTINGEAIGMKLDKPLEAGKIYTYTFTYARDGNPPNEQGVPDDFSPIVYTDKSRPSLYNALKIGRLPGTVGWTTQSITFQATSAQQGHEWIILHGFESSGTILSNCVIDQPIETKILARDTTLCQGDKLVLQASMNDRYTYDWNTGEQGASISVQAPGLYSVEIKNNKCYSSDSVYVDFEDCELRFVMPNIFTPNGDTYNPVFLPKEYNYVESGILIIYNRWGERIFTGDLFQGWDGQQSSTGIYYYEIKFTDKDGNIHNKQGSLTLSR